MEIKVLEEDKKKLLLEFKSIEKGFCNSLKSELWNDKHISASGFNVEHPLIDKIVFIVETDGKKSPRKALQDAAKRLKSVNESFKKVAKAIK